MFQQIVFIQVFLILKIFCSGLFDVGLKAHYLFQDTLDDVKGNEDLVNFSNGQVSSEDRFGFENGSYRFIKENKGVFILPQTILPKFNDFTVSFWIKNEQPFKPQQTVFQMGNFEAENLNLFTFQNNQLIQSSKKFNWNSFIKPYSSQLFNGNWQQVVVQRSIQSQQVLVFRDGEHFESISISALYDGEDQNIDFFVLGNQYIDFETSLFDGEHLFKGSISDLRIYNRLLQQREIVELYEYEKSEPVKDLSRCYSYLSILFPTTIQTSISFPLKEDSEYYHSYVIDFKEFYFQKHCFTSNLWLGFRKLEHQVEDNKILIEFPYWEADQWGCSIINPNTQQCFFQLQIQLNNITQYKHFFLAKVQIPDLENFGVSLGNSFIENDQTKVKEHIEMYEFDQTINTQLKFCETIECSSYVSDLIFIRNEDIYIELRILTEGYDKYFIKSNFVKLNEYEPKLLNQNQVDNWNQKGKIIYHFKPSFAGDSINVLVSVSLSKESFLRRMLEKESNQDLKDKVGQYVFIQVKEEEETQENQNVVDLQGRVEKKEKYKDVLIFMGYVTLVLIVVLIIVLIIYCNKFRNQKKFQIIKRRQSDDNVNVCQLNTETSDREKNI